MNKDYGEVIIVGLVERGMVLQPPDNVHGSLQHGGNNSRVFPLIYTDSLVHKDIWPDQYTRNQVTLTTSFANLPTYNAPKVPMFLCPHYIFNS